MQKLFMFLLVLLAIWYVRKVLAGVRENRERQSMQRAENPAKEQGEMIRECCRCGLLVPESEGVEIAGRFFCCAEHARQHQDGAGA